MRDSLMPKKLTQHDIRQRAVQTLYSYHVQREMSDEVMKNFQFNVGKIDAILDRPPRFEVDYQDERITVRGFQKRFTSSLSQLVEIYDILGIALDHSALVKANDFVRDFGGYAKKMRDNEAIELYTGVFSNLNFVRLFSIDLEETPTPQKVLEFLRAIAQKNTAQDQLETFNKIFSLAHGNIREKYTLEFFEPVLLQKELHHMLDEAALKHTQNNRKLLDITKHFVLNYDNEKPLEIEAPDYFDTLIDGVLNDEAALQTMISPYLSEKWSFERLTMIERVILLVGAYEITATQTPDVVAVNEAVELSKDFSDVKSTRFINGVLTHLIKK